MIKHRKTAELQLTEAEAKEVWEKHFVERYSKLPTSHRSKEKTQFWIDLVNYKDKDGKTWKQETLRRMFNAGVINHWLKYKK